VISANIKKYTGVEVKQHFMSNSEVHARVLAEAPNFAAEMVIGCGSPLAALIKNEKWSIPYDSPTWRDAVDPYKDADNYWFNLGNWSTTLVGNPDLLAAAGYELPTSWAELTDPKWKDQIIYPSALTSGNGWQILLGMMTLFGFNAGKGEEGGWEYMEALDENVHHYTRGGSDPLNLVTAGEFMLGVGTPAGIVQRAEQGYPVVWLDQWEEGFGYEGNYAFILKGTEELYTCQKLIDFLGTKESGQAFADYLSFITKDPTLETALYGIGPPRYIPNIDLTWGAENRDRLIAEWKSRFIVD